MHGPVGLTQVATDRHLDSIDRKFLFALIPKTRSRRAMQRGPPAPRQPCQQSQVGAPMGGVVARGQMPVWARECLAVGLPEAAHCAEIRIFQRCAGNIQNFTLYT